MSVVKWIFLCEKMVFSKFGLPEMRHYVEIQSYEYSYYTESCKKTEVALLLSKSSIFKYRNLIMEIDMKPPLRRSYVQAFD